MQQDSKNPPQGDEQEVPARRLFLKQAAGIAGAMPIGLQFGVAGGGAILAGPALAQATGGASAPEVAAGYASLSADEAAFVEALVNLMCPADSYTPNGVDAGLAVYIDRQLAGAFGKGAKRYMRGPWLRGKPQHGYQLPLIPEQFFKAGVEAAEQACTAKFGKGFEQITAAQAEAFLRDLAEGKVAHDQIDLAAWFNDLVYPLFNQACFADPIYGGNAGKVFWKMIGYPGLPATHTINMIQYRGKPFPGANDPKSITDFS